MTLIQQVHWELEQPYRGNPYYVPGRDLLEGLRNRIPPGRLEKLRVSHGMFVPESPELEPPEGTHTESVRLGSSLPELTAYEDLFLFRNPDQLWLPRTYSCDGVNALGQEVERGSPVLRTASNRLHRECDSEGLRTTRWFVSAYLHTPDSDVLPLSADVLDGLQVGSGRVNGYGAIGLRDTQMVDLDALDYSALEGADEHGVELITPYVLQSTDRTVRSRNIPAWLNPPEWNPLRNRRESLTVAGRDLELEMIDHGVAIGEFDDSPVETAKAGVRRIGALAKQGYGEFVVVPLVE